LERFVELIAGPTVLEVAWKTPCLVCQTCTTVQKTAHLVGQAFEGRVLIQSIGSETWVVACAANQSRQHSHCHLTRCSSGPLYEFSSQRDSSVNSWRKRRLRSTVYGSPVACLVQTRALIMGQSGWIDTQICRACSLLRSLRMKSLVGS